MANSEVNEKHVEMLRRMVAMAGGHSMADVVLGGGAYSPEWLEYALSLPEYILPQETLPQDPQTGEVPFMVDVHAIGDVPLM